MRLTRLEILFPGRGPVFCAGAAAAAAMFFPLALPPCSGAAADERTEIYRQKLKPAVFAGKDYWDTMRDRDLLRFAERGVKTDNDPLIRDTGIYAEGALFEKYSSNPALCSELIKKNAGKPFIILALHADFKPWPRPEWKNGREYLASEEWRGIEEQIGAGKTLFVYCEGSWQVRQAGYKKVVAAAKQLGLQDGVPQNKAEYCQFYLSLMKAISSRITGIDKMIFVPQAGTGYFLPLEHGSPASAYYLYEEQNMSMKNSYARGAARQYGRPMMVYFSNFPLAVRVDFPVEIDIPLTVSSPPGALPKLVESLDKKRVIPPNIHICSSKLFGGKPDSDVEIRVSSGGAEIGFRGPGCGIPVSQHRLHEFFQYLTGAGLIVREAGGTKSDYQMGKLAEGAADSAGFYTPYLKQRAELLDFAAKNGRGTPFAPVAYVLSPESALLNQEMLLASGGPYSDLEKMVFKWHERAFTGDKLKYDGRHIGNVRKVSEINQYCANYAHRREITDVLTTAVSPDILSAYPVAVSIGPGQDKIYSKMKKFADNGGVWVVNIDQLTPEALRELTGSARDAKYNEGSGWTNMVTGVENDDKGGKYTYATLSPAPAEAEVLIKDKSGAPLVLERKLGKGSAVIVLQRASLLKGAGGETLSGLLFALTNMLADRYMPVKVEGNIQSLCNIMPDGWLVTLMNHDGVRQFIGQPETFDPDCARTVTLRFKNNPGTLKELIKGESLELREKDGGYVCELSVNPGEIKVIKTGKIPAPATLAGK